MPSELEFGKKPLFSSKEIDYCCQLEEFCWSRIGLGRLFEVYHYKTRRYYRDSFTNISAVEPAFSTAYKSTVKAADISTVCTAVVSSFSKTYICPLGKPDFRSILHGRVLPSAYSRADHAAPLFRA